MIARAVRTSLRGIFAGLGLYDMILFLQVCETGGVSTDDELQVVPVTTVTDYAQETTTVNVCSSTPAAVV